MIPLVKDTIDKEDIDQLIEWLKTYPHLTKGELTLEYEERWSKMMGCKYSVFVNSGSSANLLMLYSLIEAGYLSRGDKVVVPAVSWSTDLAPVIQLGLEAILCDCNMENLSIDIDHLKEIIRKESPKALLLVSVLGLVPDMGTIADICEKNNIVLLEDACESLGSESNYKKIGNFGLMSSFSTYFGHHISTIEGGMVCTSDSKYDNILKSIRSHGWSRDWTAEEQEAHREVWGISEFDSLYTFYYCGFNVRSTDLQAFIGLNQLDKLDNIIEARNKNYLTYLRLLGFESNSKHFNSNFAFPLVNSNRDAIAKALSEEGIECRPLVCGSMSKQPFYLKKYPDEVNYLPNAERVRTYGMYLPNHHLLTEKDIERVCNVVKKYL